MAAPNTPSRTSEHMVFLDHWHWLIEMGNSYPLSFGRAVANMTQQEVASLNVLVIKLHGLTVTEITKSWGKRPASF